MIEGMAFLQSYGAFAGGGAFGSLLAQWQAAGVFSYVLPFLLIFALVFVILSNVKLFADNKAVNAVIGLAVALMALQFDFVPRFFSEIFPNFGVALAIILVFVILGGVFFDPENAAFKWIFVILGLVIAGFVVFNALSSSGFYTGRFFLGLSIGELVGYILIIAAFIAIVSAGSKPKPPKIPVYQ